MIEQGRGDGLAGELQAVVAAVGAGDLDRAGRLSDAALAAGRAHPLFFKLRAVSHERSGRLGEAIQDFRSALAMAPGDFAASSALGSCLARSGRIPEALAALDASIALNGGYAPAHCNRGWALETSGDRSGARAAYERAIAIDPNNLQALGGLAAISAQSGRSAEARDYAGRALALSPHDVTSGIALAMAEVADGEAAAAEARLRPLLQDPALPAHERGVASTVLGDALDQLGRTDEAFAAYASANAALAELYGATPATEPATGAALAGRLLADFGEADPSDWRRGPAAAEAGPFLGHLFIVGFPRSGTTLTGQVLAAHPDAVVLDEQETLADAAQAFLQDADGLGRLSRLDAEGLAPFRRAYQQKVLALADAEGKVFVDKLPMNVLGLPLIAKLFPEARVLVVRRDPRDVVLSCFRRQFAPGGASRAFFDLGRAAAFYDQVMRLTELYQARLELELMVLRYEDLVADFEPKSREVCAFAGLEWTAGLADFAAASQAREVATPSARQIRRGLYGEGVGQWRRYREALAPVMPVLQPWIERFGYEAD